MSSFTCPKCGRHQPIENRECIQCGVIFNKLLQRNAVKKEIPPVAQEVPAPEKPVSDDVTNKQPVFKCKKCNTEFTGATCPNCGQSIPVLDRGCAISLAIIILFAALIFGTLYWADKNTPGEKSFNFKNYKLDAKVFIKPPNLVIENHDSFNWNVVKIEINGIYDSKHPFIPSNQHVVIPISSFSKSDGDRLNLYNTKIKNVFIYAKTKDGTGSYQGSWD